MRRGARFALLSALLLSGACSRDGDGVVAQGTVEVIEMDVAAMQPARIIRVSVQEGDAVSAGDTIALLAATTLPADIDQRRARVRQAEAQLRDLEAGARPSEVSRLEADLAAADAEATRTAREAERLVALFDRGDVSAQQLEAARTLARVAASRRDAAREALTLLREGARADRLRGARADLEATRAALRAAEAQAADLVLVAPAAGVVLSRFADPGEVVAAGTPVVTIGDVARPYVRAWIGAVHIPSLRIGARARVTFEGSDASIPGHVSAIDSRAQFTPRAALTEDERADLMFGIRVALSDSAGRAKPGLPATVHIDTATRAARAVR